MCVWGGGGRSRPHGPRPFLHVAVPSVAELRRLRETFGQKHTMQFNKVMSTIVRSADGQWLRISRRQFHALVNQQLVAEDYEPRGLMWQLMCYRIREAITTAG